MSSEAAVLESIIRLREIDQLKKYLDYCAENRLFSCENNDTVEAIATTNRLLNESSTRRDGLLVLKCLLKQLPLKLLQTHIFSWVQQAVKGLSQKDSSSTILVALDLSGKLLSLSPNFPECRKQIAINFISKILEVLYDLKDSPGFLIPVLSTLGIVLEYYHKSLHSWKDKFEKFLISLIEKDDETVFLAARCFLAFGASGLPGADNVNYRENWVTLFKSLSSSLHSILDRLFENVNEIEQFSRGHDRMKPNFVIPTVTSAIPFVKMTRLAAQFSGLSRFLEVILLGKYPVCKKVTPELVLSVACRGLAISSQTLQSHVTSDTASLMTQLTQIHLSCLTILNALMKSCRKNLLSYGPVICKLLSQVLKATEIRKAVHGQNKPFRSVRQLTYKCLATWLTISNCSCRAEKFPELVDFLIADIQYKKPVVTLNMSTKVLKGKLGKKQRQALVNQTVENREEYVIDREANKDGCAAALEVVPILLQSASTLLPPLAQKALGEAVCSELITTQLNSIENAPLPYSDEQCRLGLYKCFVALCQDYHPEYPPPLSYAAQVLSVGLQDTCSEVARFCATASSAVDKMLRPIGPTLGLPMELPELLAPPKTAPTFVQIPRDQERRSPVMDTEDRKVNGVEVNDSANVAELEVSPLLVDPEMSDFDYSNSAKEEPRSRGEPSQKLVDDHSPTLAKKEGYDASASVIPESNLSIEVSEPIPVVNGATVKRKSVINEEESHATKKSKSKESSVAPIPIHLSESSEAVSIEVCDSLPPMTNPVENIEDEIPVRKSSPPRNNLEEEMLSSFVDEVF